MTYWVVIAMIFVAILAVAAATAQSSDTDQSSVASEDAPVEEGMTADEHF